MTFKYEYPIAAVDVVLMTLEDGELKVLLHRRPDDQSLSYPGQLALPGGHIHKDEDTDSKAAALRVLEAKIGIKPSYLEQLYTFANSARDPAGWSISIAYYALVPKDQLAGMKGSAFLADVNRIPRLAFDHNDIVSMAIERIRGKAVYSALPCHLLPKEFTMPELLATYEAVIGESRDRSSLRRKIEAQDFIEPVNEKTVGRHRPAQLYRLKPGPLATFDRSF